MVWYEGNNQNYLQIWNTTKISFKLHKTFSPPNPAGGYIWLCISSYMSLKQNLINIGMCTNNTNTCTCAHAYTQCITAPIKNSHFVDCGNWSNFQTCTLSCFVHDYMSHSVWTVYPILCLSTFSVFVRPSWSANPLVGWGINTGSLRFI